jgi:CRP/FNR family cyclic AMP-dependent transcriptional regulator
MDTQIATLSRAALLSSLSEEARTAVLERASRTSVGRREFIYVPGDASDAVFVVLRGRVRVLLLSDDGREATLDLREVGEVFGEEALAGGAARSTAAQAWEDTQVVAVPVVDLRAALAVESEAVWALASLVAERCRSTETLLDGLAFRDVGARLARCLLQLAERLGAPRADGTIVLRARLTHQDLATLVCTTRETVTLTLEKFKQEGWIAAQGRSLVLCDLLALRERAGGSAADIK